MSFVLQYFHDLQMYIWQFFLRRGGSRVEVLPPPYASSATIQSIGTVTVLFKDSQRRLLPNGNHLVVGLCIEEHEFGELS